jgi:hypothetical protein
MAQGAEGAPGTIIRLDFLFVCTCLLMRLFCLSRKYKKKANGKAMCKHPAGEKKRKKKGKKF